MHAELVIDLHEAGIDIGKALDRDDLVLPSLGKIASMWKQLGITVDTMHLVVPGYPVQESGQPSFSELHVTTWWQTESAFLEDEDFEVHVVPSTVGDDGPVGQNSLVVATALRRSDELAADSTTSDVSVIVMTSAFDATVAVSYARGVPVMLAGCFPWGQEISHTHLKSDWLAQLANRHAPLRLRDVALRNGRPWSGGIAICPTLGSTLGRDESVAVLPTSAESAVIHDPEYFSVGTDSIDTAPGASGLASVVEVLGLGESVHVEGPLNGQPTDAMVEATLLATMYRYARDHPQMPIIVASGRPGLVVATCDLDAYGLANPRRFLRLCLPERNSILDEEIFIGRSMAARVLLERSLSEPLFADDDSSVHSIAIDSGDFNRTSSPTLVLFTNPNSAREISKEWRQSCGRRFLMLGAQVTEAAPADEPRSEFLPVSLGGSTDFKLRRPDLTPGSIVEGVLDTKRERWIIVSDPIERRAVARTIILRDDMPSIVDEAA